MANFQDVSPTTAGAPPDQSATGRMLSIACSPDGQTLFAGSYSNIWKSVNGGQSWNQLTWPEPAPNQFGVPGSLGGWCVLDMAVFPGWTIEDPRFLADLTGKGHADIVGFGDTGVWTALSRGDGTFSLPQFQFAGFGPNAGGWVVEKHPRFVTDITGDGRADIVGFGDAGVWVALGNGDGSFQSPRFVIANFGYDAGEWRVEKHPRLLADLTGKGRADIVGFGDAGVWTALSNGDGTFQPPKFVLANFGYVAGDWRVEKHPRFLADLTGNGHADIVGFGDQGVWTALGNGDGTFQPAKFVLANFGDEAGGWLVEKHPRFLADLTGKGRSSIVGFGDAGVWTAMSNGDGTFAAAQFVIANFGYVAGDWRVEKHIRLLANLKGSGGADIVAFGDAGVWTALGNGDGTFQPPRFVIANFGYVAGDWRVDEHPRLLADLSGNKRADIVGFGDAGVWTAMSLGDGTFQSPNFVTAYFGYQVQLLAITRFDRENNDSGVWRSSDAGANWTQVFRFPADSNGNLPAMGQIARAPGTDNLVYIAGGTGIGISRDGGMSFQLVVPNDPKFAGAFHIAVAPLAPNATVPQAIYVINIGTTYVSLDGGATWIRDQAALPPHAGGAVSDFNSVAPSVLVVSPASPFQVFVVAFPAVGGATISANLFRGDYSTFAANKTGVWTEMTPPPVPNPFPDRPFRDSGCIFLAATPPGAGNLLFLNPLRTCVYVSTLNPQSASDWVRLDQGNNVHADLHGFLLTPDFQASIANGKYQPKAGKVWLLSDGGVHSSSDGGLHFASTPQHLSTFSCVNVGGVAIPGKPPALSLNQGDNDGYYSTDGGASWSPQDYGGGDNDCSFADPLRSYSMLVNTPRRNSSVTVYETSSGSLPNAAQGTNQGHGVPGPPTGFALNASSFFGERGSRPFVYNLPSDDPSAAGDYVFVRFTTVESNNQKINTQAILLRSLKLKQIGTNDWIEFGTDSRANLFQQGPVLPDPNLGVVQATGGHTNTVFYVGGNPSNQLFTWTAGMASWKMVAPVASGAGPMSAVRFFVSPYNSNLIYVLDQKNVWRSDNAGASWQVDQSLQTQLTGGGRIPVGRATQSDLNDNVEFVLTDMQFDPFLTSIRFAIGEGGVFYTNDGANWNRLLDTGATPGRPMNCYYDRISNISQRALYVSFAGRGLLNFSPLPSDGLAIVPSLFGLPATVAQNDVGAAHLISKFTTTPKPNDVVSSQAPQAGTLVLAESTVTMFLEPRRPPITAR